MLRAVEENTLLVLLVHAVAVLFESAHRRAQIVRWRSDEEQIVAVVMQLLRHPRGGPAVWGPRWPEHRKGLSPRPSSKHAQCPCTRRNAPSSISKTSVNGLPGSSRATSQSASTSSK
uniref:Secreted protein n=1 Tax=Leishmania donovani TaxID=5661 RepID=Q962N9_LEIDO|nr:unknown [Leishmania donovani]